MSAARGEPVIEMRGIVKSFYLGTPNELEILHGINLTIREGEFVSIVGASGSGKSTLMNIIGALDHQTAGEYTLDGVPMTEMSSNRLSEIRNEKIGFKIREAQMEKVPYMFVLGDKEAENGTVAVRGRKGDLGTMTLDEILARIQEEIRTKARD